MTTPDPSTRDLDEAIQHYESFLRSLGPILPEEDFAASARRATSVMAHWTRNVGAPAPTMSVFPAPQDPGWVGVSRIAFHALCEHHMLPFFGHVDIAILPDATIAGFGSIVRLVEGLCLRPQLQEGLAVDIADAIASQLSPRGSLVRISARQLCMEMQGRGVGSVCVTLTARGAARSSDGRLGALASLDALPHPATASETS